MTLDLTSMTRKELEKLKSRVEKALEKVSAKELKAAREAAAKAAAEHGFSLDDITGAPAPKKRGPKPKADKAPKAAGKPKYRNPADASQTWTGKGRQPNWFKQAVDAGTDPKTLEI